jgi:hypothetical protein
MKKCVLPEISLSSFPLANLRQPEILIAMTTLYQEIRAAGKAMVGKAMEATKHLDFHPARIAKRMTLPTSGKILLFDGETTQNAFFDFWVHEYRVHGKSLVESVDPVAAGLTALETEVLEAHRHARTSLFLTESARPMENQVRLRDLLVPDHPEVVLTDIGLSGSIDRLRVQASIFFRLVTVRGLSMTSGFSFGFDSRRAPGLLDGYRKRIKKVPPTELAEARFVFFFQKFRECGADQAYQDVV